MENPVRRGLGFRRRPWRTCPVAGLFLWKNLDINAVVIETVCFFSLASRIALAIGAVWRKRSHQGRLGNGKYLSLGHGKGLPFPKERWTSKSHEPPDDDE